MRGWRGGVDRVQTGFVRSALSEGVCWVWRARFVMVGLVFACVVGLWWGLGSIGTASALAGECPNEAARQGPSVNLPECRAYEQVTPVDKGDAIDIFGSHVKGQQGIAVDEGNNAYVAEDGDAILVHTDGSFAPRTTASGSSYVFSRGTEEWNMHALAQSVDEPQEVGEEGFELFDPIDLSEVSFSDVVGTVPEEEHGDESAYRRSYLLGPMGGPYAPLYSFSGAASRDAENYVEPAGGSEDLSRVVLQSENHSLAPGAEGQDEGSEALYESVGGGECGGLASSCRLVDVNSEGRAMPCGATLGQGELGFGGAHSAVSSDGSRIFFTAPQVSEHNAPPLAGVGCWNRGVTPQENPPEVYVREDGSRTVEVSISREALPHEVGSAENPLLPAVFVGASSDGSKVFFLTKTELTKNAMGHAPELYEYETESGRLTLVSGDVSGTVEGDVDSVTAVSSDGSTVYFSAYGKLAESAQTYPPGTEAFSPVNLYRYDTITGETRYITTLNKYDYPLNFGSGATWYTEELGKLGTEHEGLTSEKEWYTTGDGQFLVFGTVLPLTGFDNFSSGVACPDNYNGAGALSEDRCLELYRYDAATGGIVCVSCVGSGPVDGAYFARASFDSPAVGPPRPISENGEDVFFESASALVPEASPGRNHVYEWHEGAVSLISSPSDPGNAIFLGSSADGSNVFFVTHAQLVAQDTDQAADIYDARVDGGFSSLTGVQCTGTGCQGVPSPPPIFATPAGVTFEGVGNFPTVSVSSSEGLVKKGSLKKTVRCRRGFVKRRGGCVKKRVKRAARGRK